MLNLWDFSLPLYLSFLFHFDQLNYVNKSDVSASRNSSQNAAIQENLKTNEAYERTHYKSNIQLLIFL